MVAGIVVSTAGAPVVGALAAEIVPHHAVYSMSLGATHGDAGVTGAGGTMAYQWGEVCDGWTVEQRYRLKMAYAESSDVSISSNFVTWEAKDGLKYRFNQKETRNGTDNDEIRGEAKLEGPDKGGTVAFEKPEAKTLKLPAGTLFPSAHTISLIDKAKAGENFISKLIFDGATMENSVLVTAVIGAKVEPDEESAKKSPLLQPAGLARAARLLPGRPEGREARLPARHGLARQWRFAGHGDRLRRVFDPRQARRHRGAAKAEVPEIRTGVLRLSRIAGEEA